MTSGIEKVKSCSCELYFLEMFLSAWHKNGKSSAVFSDISILFDFIKSPQGTENYSEPSTLLILNVLNNSFALFCSVLKKLFPAQREDSFFFFFLNLYNFSECLGEVRQARMQRAGDQTLMTLVAWELCI